MSSTATAYAPGLTVTSFTRHRVRRILPISGDVRVAVGDLVGARDVVAQTFIPGDITPLNISKLLSLPPEEVPACMLKKEREAVSPGDVLARTKGVFGRFKQDYVSAVSGTVESISGVTGLVIVRGAPVPIEVRAYLTGRVEEVLPGEGCVIESAVALIQGIFGVGGEAFGPLKLACQAHDQELSADLITLDMSGAVVVGGARMTLEAINRARSVGAVAIVSGGLDDADLEKFLGYNLGVAITGSEKLGITVIVTEGFGEIAMAERTFALFAKHEGADSAVNGTTQIRAGVIRPEIVIPLGREATADQRSGVTGSMLRIGAPVRVIRDPYFGVLGTVSALPPEPHVLESGSRARVLEVRFESGHGAIIPRANVEIIEG
jgi:transcription antitermination factor NusG